MLDTIKHIKSFKPTFWNVYALVYITLGLLVALTPEFYRTQPIRILDNALCEISTILVAAYAFRKRFGNAYVWKLLAAGFTLVDGYIISQSAADEGLAFLSVEGILTTLIIAALSAPSFYAANAYAWGRLAPLHPAKPGKPAPAHAATTPATPAVKAAGAPIKPSSRLRRIELGILQSLLGLIAFMGIAAYGATIWTWLNGWSKVDQLFAADPLYALMMIDHINAWLVLGTGAIAWLAFTKRKFRIGAGTMLVVLALVSAGTSYLHIKANEQTLASPAAFTAAVDASFKLDPRLEALANETGINLDDLKRAKAQVGEPLHLNDPCSAADIIGCFANGQIYIYPAALEQDRVYQRDVLAHEYLHWVWANTAKDERDRLVSYLNIMYGQHQAWLDERTGTTQTDECHPGSDCFTDELHSYLGTEADRKLLPQPLQDWYAKWLPQADALPKDLTDEGASAPLSFYDIPNAADTYKQITEIAAKA